MIDSSWLRRRLHTLARTRVEEYDVPGEDALSLVKGLGLDFKDVIKLDANENLMLPREFAASELCQLSKFLDTRIYPLNEKAQLTSALADYLDVNTNQIVIGNSSDDILEIIARVFLKGRVGTVSITPTFEMYKVITHNFGHNYIEVPLRKDFTLDAEDLLEACDELTHICFLCSPNNPTGNQFSLSQVKSLVEKFNGLVVIDEAYVEYGRYSLVSEVKNYDNIIVLRTFSKAFGLAGLRVGYAVTSQKIASELKRIQLPYNVNMVSLEMARRILKRFDQVETSIERIKIERSRLIKEMKNIPGVFPYDSNANFIFFRTLRSSRQVRDHLAQNAILIRCYDSQDLANYLRVTVGTKDMNNRFLEVLKEVMDV
ncbi:histidinol-phosphate transaminase [Candidatus Bathyarchaeota archaeon]|nr:histidinol-phosphate transaminase [Candidatus Bathyarchaeota archaeon]